MAKLKPFTAKAAKEPTLQSYLLVMSSLAMVANCIFEVPS